MIRGLSRLQKEILRLGWRNRKEGKIAPADVSNREVLAKFYGFEPLKPLDKTEQGALVFDRQAIGIGRYNAGSVATAKAFNRLVKRGLAERKYNRGIVLTELGLETAKFFQNFAAKDGDVSR